jgi:hypothetical protein
MLSNFVHRPSPNLDFCRKTEHPQNRRMNTLVTIKFRNRNIILNLFDERGIIFMNNSQNHITIRHRIRKHSKCQQIHNSRNIISMIFLFHFFENSKRTLNPSLHRKITNSFFLQNRSQAFNPFIYKFFSGSKIFFNIFHNRSKTIRIEHLK